MEWFWKSGYQSNERIDMIQITIDWDFISPSIQTVSGLVTISYVAETVTNPWITLAKFRVRVEPGSVGYSSLDKKGIPSVVLEAVKPQLDVMVRSYQQGVIMDKKDFTWIIESDIDNAREELRKIPTFNEKNVIFKTCEDHSKV